MNLHKLDKTIKKYKGSFNPYHFRDILQSEINNNPNPYYYHKVIDNWGDKRYNDLVENEHLKSRVALLKDYLLSLRWLMIYTVDLYEAIDRYDGTERAIINDIQLNEDSVKRVLKAIENFKISINENYEKGKYKLSIKLKNYCLSKFIECITIMENDFFIKIYDSPIHKKFEIVRDVYEELIDLDEVEILQKKGRNRENYKDTIWFKVGMLFATDKIEELKSKYHNNFTQYAKSKFGEKWSSYRVYISESFNRNNKSNKNIFKYPDKLKKIYDHCVEEKISMTDNFKDNLHK